MYESQCKTLFSVIAMMGQLSSLRPEGFDESFRIGIDNMRS